MKRIFAILALILLPRLALAADANAAEETQLIAVLQSSQSLPEQADACARLKWIGTARSVPALAKLLTDAQLSHSARYALESMQCREAGEALAEAATATTGSNQVGIVDSLGVRRDAAAVPVLAGLLSNADAQVAAAAAEALGKVGGKEACQALQEAWQPGKAGPAHAAQCDGLLAIANRFLTDRDDHQAAKNFRRFTITRGTMAFGWRPIAACCSPRKRRASP